MSNGLAETAEEVSRIAFGFMASKALFAGLHIGVFTLLADGPKKSADIAKIAEVPMNRVTTLMTALTSIGLKLGHANLLLTQMPNATRPAAAGSRSGVPVRARGVGRVSDDRRPI